MSPVVSEVLSNLLKSDNARLDPLPFRKYAVSIDIFILPALGNHGRLSMWTIVKWKEERNAGF
jgi:hypothetical protein